MTDRSRTERRLIASIRHAKTGDEAPATAKQPNPQPRQEPPSTPVRRVSAGGTHGYQSPGRVWPD